MAGPKEFDFETQICEALVAQSGYAAAKVGTAQGDPRDFDRARGLDTAELFAFIGATQADEWAKLIELNGGDANEAQKLFANRVAKVIDERGTIEVLRQGVDDLGVNIRLAYFKPSTSLNAETLARYEANRLTVTRQLPYETTGNKTLDLCLFVNGVPVATAELKTHLTGQTAEHAKAQYETDRDPANTTLGKRAIVHFAVDTEVAWMTTRLAGKQTRWLHFNRGRDHGAGNPDNPNGHRTSYLWEQVWARDALLDILGRFVHVEPTPKGKQHEGEVIFPRFHQWDAVLKIADHARDHGAGHNYLVQHSAGSGKSNTIAWLAHRLSTLHAADDTKIFDKVIVITDRQALDRQMQETVGQFEKVAGVVQKIDESSAQLAEALEGEQARIIITTIQKFPFALEKIESLPNRRYAVIADEAHSSQSGETAKDVRKVLKAQSEEATLAAEELAELGSTDEVPDPVQDQLEAQVAARGKQPNISFFAFTATPKARTLEMFGDSYVDEAGEKKYRPFHLYSMRQAIQEGYIHDVLANYTTYQTYWNIEKKVEDDPEYDPGRAKAAIAKFVSLHEHNLAQKADIIINHYRSKVAHLIGGQAKAMVVTASRLHALRYGLALRRYCEENGIDDVGVLVAFSGTLNDNGIDHTETSTNGFPESQTPARFDTDEYQILVVAEKYQTGFDQPKLHTMYVDKPLSGLAAVQTLSRLNRSHPQKDSTFVLDFRNGADDIRRAFAPWYVQTEVPPTDPNLMYDAHHQLSQYDVLRVEETEAFAAVLLEDPTASDRIHGILEPAKSRFWETLDEDEQGRFRDALKKYVSAYGYLAQIVPFGDIKLERDYVFCRALAQFIRAPSEALPDLSHEVDLTHLATRLVAEEESISLPDDEGDLSGPGEILGRPGVPDAERLSEIIKRLNERYGTNFDPADRLFFDGLVDKLAEQPAVQHAAAANSPENFRIAMAGGFQDAVIDQMATAGEITKNFLDNADFANDVLQAYMPLLQTKAKVARQLHCPVGELLAEGEGNWLEFKSTFHVDAETGEPNRNVETAAIKTVAGFLNSWDGGTLLMGVAEDDAGKGVPFGMEGDYAQFHKDGKADDDTFLLAFNDKLKTSLGAAAVSNVTTQMATVDGKDICRVHVKPSGHPVDAKVRIVDAKGNHMKQTNFYARINNGTHKFIDEDEKQKYIAHRWPGS
ncbi:MAG: DEAD/DEAH box helicase family protein [Acidimicrobiales bacterium]